MPSNRPSKPCRRCGAPFMISAADFCVNCPACRGRKPAASAPVAAAPAKPKSCPCGKSPGPWVSCPPKCSAAA